MGHYLDLQLRPDPELAPHHLLSALYGRLHRALARSGTNDIGVSFPDYDGQRRHLGERLRLCGPAQSLRQLMASNWLRGIQDHLRIGTIEAVPAAAAHRLVSRVQVKSNAGRQRRRAIKRHGLTPEQAVQRIPDSAEKRLALPFITLGSASTGQTAFPVFIRVGPPLAQPLAGAFNSYGLSSGASVPWF